MAAGIRTACPYCGVGCGIIATPQPDGTVDIKGDADHPSNFGRLCSKGAALGETLDLDGRLLYPEVGGARAGWDTALDLVADRFKAAIADYGPDSVAFYLSGQILTEDYYVANKLMKGYIGAANIDTNSRLCMASSVAGHRRAFGADTVPGTYEDLELADAVVLVGANLMWCHPVLYQRIAAAKARRPQMRVVLVDPRRTMTADLADLHLAIEPDGDVALFAGLLAHLAENGCVDAAYVGRHTGGFDAALKAAQSFSREEILARTGLPTAQLAAFYALWSGTGKVVTAYSQGVNQSACGSDKVNAIINCHLATGRIGRPGMGPFSLTGQPNAMGGREVGGLANMLAAHMDIDKPEHCATVQRFWRSPVIAGKPGLKAVDLFTAVGDGRIKALWIMATNPAVSLPDADAVQKAIRACPFVVVSDVVAATDTVRHAHVKLPSLGWGEKEGTVTNSERRISRQRAFLPAPGEARADWWQMAQVGRRMGFADAFDWPNAAAVFREYARQTAFKNHDTRDLDLGACAEISDEAYDALAPLQWPKPHGATLSGDVRFFARGGFYTPDRRARFVAIDPAAGGGAADDDTLTLNTGRVRDHWHTMTRTGRSVRLSAHMAEPYCEIHPQDAAARDIRDADLVRLSNAQGSILVRALVSERQKAGNVFVPMHWNDQTASAARVDTLVAAVTDPVSGQPASKFSRVCVEHHAAGTYGFAVGVSAPACDGLGYWVRARTSGGWRLEFAAAEAVDDPECLLRQLFALPPDTPFATLAVHDRARGTCSAAAFDGDRLICALFVAAHPVDVARSWVCAQLSASHDNQATRWRVLAGRPGADMLDNGAIVCACMTVGVNEIAAAVRQGCRSLDAVVAVTGAGSGCGSCRAEIRQLVEAQCRVAAE